MSIIEPLSFPTQSVARIVLRQVAVVGVNRAIFGGTMEVLAHPGQWWEMDITWPTLQRANAEEVFAFIGKCNGMQRRFNMGDPSAQTARGGAGGDSANQQVDGGSQTGNTLSIKNAPSGEANYLRAGDYIQLGTGLNAHLHKVLNDVTISSAGTATLDIWPNLRESPNDSDTVFVNNTEGLWRLSSNDNEMSIDEALFYGISLTAIEAI